MRDVLAAAVSPDYFVRIQERVYITDPSFDAGFRLLVPDVIVTSGRPQQRQPIPATSAVISPSVEIAILMEPEVRDLYLEVLDRRTHEVVTAIELLSPANKTPGARGRTTMLEKRRALVEAGANYLEIDLLRGGERETLLAWRSDYVVALQRARRPQFEVWFADLRDPLPTVAVPLRPPHPDVPLELQPLLGDVFARARYADSLDYSQPVPPPPLPPADAAWVTRQIAAWQSSPENLA
jgi:hypothetical protein